MKFKYTSIVILIVFMTFLTAGCGSSGGGGDDGGGSDSGDSTTNGGSSAIDSVSVTSGAPATGIVADGASQTLISATVLDTTGNNVADGTSVSFTTTAGDIDSSTVGVQTTYSSTTTNGVTSAILTSPTNVGTANITATAGGVSDTTSVSFISGAVNSILLTATPNNLTADSSSSSTIRAFVTDVNGNAVANGEIISFSVTSGTGVLSAPTAATTGGVATVIYTASDTADTETVTAEATNGTTKIVNITLIDASIGSVTVTSGSASILADGASQTLISATVLDTTGNNVADGTSVSFTTTAGDIDSSTVGVQTTYSSTTTNGVTSAILTSPTNVGTANITATAGGVSDTTSVSFISGAVNSILLTATPNNLTADSSSSSTIRAFVTDVNGNAVANGEIISFSVTSGTGVLSAPTAATTGGVATVIYTASDTADTETVTAEATNGTTKIVNITLIDASIGSVTVTSGSASILADGASQTLISATVLDTTGNNVADGTSVSFTTTAGDIDSSTVGVQTTYSSTTTNGVTSAILTSPTNVGTANITATAGGVSDTTSVSFISGAVNSILLTATPNNLTADSSSSSTIRAFVTDVNGNAVANGEIISFSVTSGTGVLSAPTAATTGGVATVIYTASDTADTETVTAEATNGTTKIVNITLIDASIGSVTVTSGSASILADGASQTLISATVLDTTGNNVADGTSVSFTTTAGDIDSSTVGVQTTYSSTTTNGVTSAILTSPTNVGTANITATAGGVSDTTSVSFISGAVNSILLTATPNNLTADSSSSSTIRAFVTDVNGNAVANGEIISFSVTSGTGVLSAPTAATTGGVATVIYTASDTAGTETVTAEATNGTTKIVNITLIDASIGSVTVTSGSASILADGASQTLISATVLDTTGNNVADGTSVSFTTTAGDIDSSTVGVQTTYSSTTTNGVTSAILTSPTNVGTANITATAGGVSDTTTISFIPGPPADGKVNVTATPANLTADGTSTSTIRVTVFDAKDNPVADGETLTFSAEFGVFSNLTATTIDGVCEVTYTAPNYVPPNGDTVDVETTNEKTGSASITLIGPKIAGIELTANPVSIPADGNSQVKISATLTLVGGKNVPDGTSVNFSITQSGGGNITELVNTAGGVAIATLTSSSEVETVVVRAESGGKTAEIEIKYTPGSVELAIVPNSLLGTGEKTAVITVILKNAAGSPVPGESVEFTINPLSLGSLSSPIETTDNDGEAEVTFNAAATGGTVVVTATWKSGGVDVTGSSTIDIQPPPAFIEIAEGYPDPVSINIKGTGGQSTSQIIFDVKDSQGNPVADGYPINFSIDSGPNGGENIQPLSVATLNGQAGTILRSGSKSGPVSIKATYYYDTNISTITSQIAINAGQPVGEEFGIFAQYLNITGVYMANLEDSITINAGDIYGNAIPDNTAISFKTYNTGGFFTPNIATTIDGLASNILHSSGTYTEPLQGFVSVTAEANNGGRTTHVTSIVVTPGDSNYIYAGTDGGGVYKSTNSGATWANISRSSTIQGQNWIDPYINYIAIDPDDPNIIYAATGYLGKGNLYRSADGGMSWNSNNVEEWNGVLSTNAAVLTVLCDDAGSDYVWAGAEGLGAVYASNGEDFQWGGIVEPRDDTQENTPGIYSNPNNTGDGTMSKPTLSAISTTEDWTVLYESVRVDTTTPILDTSASGSNADGTMTNVSATESAKTETWTVTYTGGYNDDVSGGGIPPGGLIQGALTVISTSASTRTENWTVTCTDGTDASEKFNVKSDTGFHANLSDLDDIYTSDNNEVTFRITQTGDFTGGEEFEFSTTKDGWSVSGSESTGITNTAGTDSPYQSDNNEVSFTINSGNTIFYKKGDQWTFKTNVICNWKVDGKKSGIQLERAETGQLYSSDSYEVTFLILDDIIDPIVPFAADDEFTFSVTESGLGYGKTVRDIVKVPGTNKDTAVLYAATSTGVFKSENGGQRWEEPYSFTGDYITTLALHPDSNGTTNDIIYAGTEDAGVWVSIDSGMHWNQYTTGMGEGLSATIPVADSTNKGNGVMSEVEVGANTLSENWTVNSQTAETFSIMGSVSGPQTNTATVGVLYMSDDVEVIFIISAGSTPFAEDDAFTFSTTRDPGRKIKDILVDKTNNQLYAITQFAGHQEPHAVGNVYVIELDPGNSYTPTETWKEANTGLPEYDPPDDITLFPQHVMAADDPDNPTALYLGGEGINLFKATSGLPNGAPVWQSSKSGLTNLIMTRMPILFSGLCDMDVTENSPGNYTVYIQDTNGNPPVVGSTFKVEHIIAAENNKVVVVYNTTYPDCYTHTGTFRDPADTDTDIPYVFSIAVATGDKVEFTFTPTCEDEAPGCSGAVQTETYTIP